MNKKGKKADFAEEIVRKEFFRKGYMVYTPKSRGAHLIDAFVMKEKDFSKAFAYDVKAKARRNKYEDTGINIDHYNQYMELAENHNITVNLFFADELIGEIYGGNIKTISKPDGTGYPLVDREVIYFPLRKMRHLMNLTTEEIMFLRENSSRHKEYTYPEHLDILKIRSAA